MELDDIVNDVQRELRQVEEQLGHVDGLVVARHLDESYDEPEAEIGGIGGAPAVTTTLEKRNGYELTTRESILALLATEDHVFTSGEVVTRLARNGARAADATVRSYLSRMAEKGEIARPKRGYYHRLGADHLWANLESTGATLDASYAENDG